MRLVEKWWCEHISKSVERETFIHSSKNGSELKEKFLLDGFAALLLFFFLFRLYCFFFSGQINSGNHSRP